MPSQSRPDDRTQPLHIRRPIEMPVTDVEAAEDLAPASEVADETAPALASASARERASETTPAKERVPTAGSASEGDSEQSAPAGDENTDADAPGPAAAEEDAGNTAEPAPSPDEGTEPTAGGEAGAKDDSAGGEEGEKEKAGKKAKRGTWLRNVAAASASPDGAAAAGDEMPPDRPRKPVLAAVAIGGVVLLAIPILLVGTGSHDGKKQRTTVAANRVMTGDGPAAPGAYVPVTPTPTVSPSGSPSASSSRSASPSASARIAMPAPTKKNAGAGQGVTAQSRDGFRGVANVLLKNVVGGSCADVPGYDREWAGLNLQTGDCTPGDTDNQVWSLRVENGLNGPGGRALFTIRNTKSEACMDLHGTGAGRSGTAVDQDYCRPTKGDNQLWYLTHVRGSLYEIHNAASHGLCLGVGGRSGAAGKPLQIHRCGGSDGWSWSSGG
ncbi:RICIN domain-containing protein [Actinoallomurus spadix]|uniref:Ricin B lectin domain-containing protein n=1 Tax=Actinoallomurus spadix TaxID=79912 RepID=A0ABN0WL38_9ACTN|nr:RICIN domain-containing protein [Actinoallomurus spadix]MCO5991648.1 RICIN domain-containing protein [Actinoallomurus spadix]